MKAYPCKLDDDAARSITNSGIAFGYDEYNFECRKLSLAKR